VNEVDFVGYVEERGYGLWVDMDGWVVVGGSENAW